MCRQMARQGGSDGGTRHALRSNDNRLAQIGSLVKKSNRGPAEDLGQRIRELRRRNKVTLRALAHEVGVSESFVSQVERGVANPSMATLRRMAEALGESVASLFVGGEVTGMVVRAGERKRMAHPAGSLDDYLLTPAGAKTLQVIYSAIAVGQGSGDEPYSHAADEECVIILSGQLDVGVSGELHRLATGDALLLDPKQPHSYHNPGPEPATALWVMSPPIY
jgi:transcriptional regulator with XRE-family HTH domain